MVCTALAAARGYDDACEVFGLHGTAALSATR
jgi:ammonia channel protein AmtB